MTEGYDVTDAAGLAETRLPASLLARLPGSVAPAPWQTTCTVTAWLHPVDADALAAYPDTIRPARPGLVAWALVRYADTPVGPYSELAATLLAADGDGYGHIPFIVVDSLPSIVGGRRNWLLPKALASFDRSADGRAVTVRGAEPAVPAWSVAVQLEPAGPPAPVTLHNKVQQADIDGVVRRFDGTLTGELAGATVAVEGHAEGVLAALLRDGTYEGSVMTDCRFDVGPLDPR
jgi:Acetoacetate decarboxylase (ADC)